MSEYSPVWPHGNLTKVFQGLYIVRGTNITSFNNMTIQHSRNMVIIENDGNLTLVNTVRLNEKELHSLEKLGKVKHILSIGAFHGRDDQFYLDKYDAELWTVHPDKIQQRHRIPVIHSLNDKDELPLDNARFFKFHNAYPREGFIYLDDQGGIVITCDSIKNWLTVDEFFNEETANMAISAGEISKARISPIWLNATGVKKCDFNDLLQLNFRHLISAHGDVLFDTAYQNISNSVSALP